MSNTLSVGKTLVDLCNQGKNVEAIETLYSPDVISIEAMAGSPSMPQKMEGLEAIKQKNKWWIENHEIHDSKAEGPYPNGDRFIVHFKMDVTPKVGPMANQRITLDETGLYTVKGGKVTEEEFFYAVG